MKKPRILLAAPKSGSGKTLITCAFLGALKKKGFIRMVRVVNEVGFYQLTREAVEAFQKDEVFGVDCYPDHIAVLRPFSASRPIIARMFVSYRFRLSARAAATDSFGDSSL